MRRFFPCAVVWLAASWLRAGLELDKDPVELKAKPEDEVIESEFTFTNKSDKPVRITGLESACSCLEASLDKAVYQPGEKGKGVARFKVSSFVGRHEKVLHIYTDHPDEQDKVVTFVIDIPAIVMVEPDILEWIIGGKTDPQSFTVKIAGPDPIKITEITSSRETVKGEIKEITAGREYRITLTPTTTESYLLGFITMKTDSKIPKYQRQMAFFNIVRPEESEKRKKQQAEKK